MPRRIAAIDIGSNALRLIVAELDRTGRLRTAEKWRQPVRLGADVFHDGSISEQTYGKFVIAFDFFKRIVKQTGAELVRIVATSALREAVNRQEFIEKIYKKTGLRIELISGETEARLVYQAVSHALDLTNKSVAFLDIGGGSLELGFSLHGELTHSKSFPFGTVRLLEVMRTKGFSEIDLSRYLRKEMVPLFQFIRKDRPQYRLAGCVGTGGNMESFGKLRVELLGKNSPAKLSYNELSQLLIHVGSMSFEERVHVLKLRPDRADVILPAMITSHMILERLDVSKLLIPHVGVREGILWEKTLPQHLNNVPLASLNSKRFLH